MGPGPLFVFVLLQGASVVLLTAALGLAHAVGSRRSRRRAAELERGRALVRALLTRRCLPGEAVGALDEMPGAIVGALVHEVHALRDGRDRDIFHEVLRGTSWHADLVRRARSRLWWRRLAAARALSEVATAEHLLVVHALIEDEEPAVRLAAAPVIERLASPGLATALLERAIAARGAERNVLIEILAGTDTLVLPLLEERLRAPCEPDTLRVLLDLAARVRFPSLLPLLVPQAAHASREIRIAAATCLAHFPHPQSAGALRRLLEDPAWPVRARAAAALGTIGAVEAVDELLEALRDRAWWVRLRAALALRLLGPIGVEALRRVDPADDRFAHDMSRYVLSLDDRAVAEHVGGTTVDSGGMNLGALAS